MQHFRTKRSQALITHGLLGPFIAHILKPQIFSAQTEIKPESFICPFLITAKIKLSCCLVSFVKPPSVLVKVKFMIENAHSVTVVWDQRRETARVKITIKCTAGIKWCVFLRTMFSRQQQITHHHSLEQMEQKIYLQFQCDKPKTPIYFPHFICLCTADRSFHLMRCVAPLNKSACHLDFEHKQWHSSSLMCFGFVGAGHKTCSQIRRHSYIISCIIYPVTSHLFLFCKALFITDPVFCLCPSNRATWSTFGCTFVWKVL